MAENCEQIEEDSAVNPPDFLNRGFFEDILRKYENNSNLLITNLKITSATNPGDNFSSIVLKAEISYTAGGEVNTKFLIIKTVPVEDGSRKEMLQYFPVFEREAEMYSKILPEMRKIMDSIGDSEEFAPRLIYSSQDPKVLIFDDVTQQGYTMHIVLHNFENTVNIVRKLAKFHALSFYIKENIPSLDLTKYRTVTSKEGIEKAQVFYGGLEYLKDEVKNWPGYQKIAEKLESQSCVYVDDLLKTYEPNPEPGLNVLCHADFHIKNLMFKMENQSVTGTMILDFQLCHWGSPAIDLVPIFYAIGDSECRRRRSEILFIYQASLGDYMTRLGCSRKPPKLLELNMEMLKMGALEIVWGIAFLPFFYPFFAQMDMAAVENPSPEAMNRIRKIMYSNEDVVAALKEILPDLLYRGILY